VTDGELLFAAGDSNGHVGEDREGFEELMGIYGIGERNLEGKKDIGVLPGEMAATGEHVAQEGYGDENHVQEWSRHNTNRHCVVQKGGGAV
jgi:hypothetical protein